jgi:predicted nuclease of predicted toxin-antitoxin system
MKILIDMNLSPVWVKYFTENGLVSQHWSAIGKATDPDKVIFEYARQNGFVVFTHDLDFGTVLAATNANSPSVFQIRSHNLLPEIIGPTVLKCLKEYSEFLKSGCLITLFDQKSKIRLLPLH